MCPEPHVRRLDVGRRFGQMLDLVELQSLVCERVELGARSEQRECGVADAHADAKPTQQWTIRKEPPPTECPFHEGGAVFADKWMALDGIQAVDSIVDDRGVDASKTRGGHRDVPSASVAHREVLKRRPVQAVPEIEGEAADELLRDILMLSVDLDVNARVHGE